LRYGVNTSNTFEVRDYFMGERFKRVLSCFLLLSLSAMASGPDGPKTDDTSLSAYLKEIERWRTGRVEEVTGENGWLTLVGLFWLKPGENRFGSDATNDIVLPQGRAPALAGSVWLEAETVRLESRPGSGITYEGKTVTTLDLKTDADQRMTVLSLGPLRLFVIKRGERYALRVRDHQHPARSTFRGISHYPVDLKWRVEARFDPYDPPKVIPIVNVLGMVDNQKSPGAVAFEIGGKSYRLDAIEEKSESRLFIIFADATNGKQTYGAGRYLYVAAPDSSGRTVVDFNKAENPPCAFTSFATCPLPPRQNRLRIRVEAGEKKYEGPAH
jgi:uncharacterized protein